MGTTKNAKTQTTPPGYTVSTSSAPSGGSGGKTGSKSLAWEFFALATIPLVLVLGNSMLIPVLPEMQKALHITSFQTSLLITLFSLTAGIFIPIIGYLSDRYTRKAVIIPALIIYGAGGVIAGLAAIGHSYSFLMGARIMQGLGAAGTAPIAMALIGDMYKGGTESQALGLSEAANGTGKVVSPIIGSLLALIVWYAAFFAFPLFCLISLLAVIFLIKEPKKEKKAPDFKAYIGMLVKVFKEKGKWLIPCFLAGAMALFILFGVLFYLSDILENKPYNIKGMAKGLVLAIPLLGLVISSFTTGNIIKKNGKLMRWLMNIGLILMAAALALTVFFYNNIYIFIGLLTLSSIGTGLLLPCLNTMITGSIEKEQRGMVTSLYSSLRFFGVAFGPPIFGWLMAISHRTIFITVSFVTLLTLIMVFFLIKPDKKVG